MTKRTLKLALLLFLVLLVSGCNPSRREQDITQERLDTALPSLGAERIVGQTFVSRHPNLSSVEILLVRYRPKHQRPEGTSQLTFHLRSTPQDASDIITVAVDTTTYEHNAPLTFSFDPQRDSQGKRYYFFLEGIAGDDLSVWYNSVDAYGQGRMYLNGEPQEGDLRFTTGYTYDLPLLWRDLRTVALRYAWPTALALLILLVPGWFLRTLLALPRRRDPLIELAETAIASLAALPLILLWTTTIGIRLGRGATYTVILTMAGVAIWLTIRRGDREPGERPSPRSCATWLVALGLFFLCSPCVFCRYETLRSPSGWIPYITR